MTAEELTAQFADVQASKDVSTGTDATGDSSEDTGTTPVPVTHPCGEQPYQREVLECAAEQGVFAAGTAPCPEPAERHRVASIVIHDTGGLGPLSAIANPYIAANISGESPIINVHLLKDGTFATNCPGAHAWITAESDIQADCQPKYTGRFPVPIVGGAVAVVENAVFDLATGTVTGLVDRAALVEQLDTSLQPVAENNITLDVDTDNDGTPDRASATLTVCF